MGSAADRLTARRLKEIASLAHKKYRERLGEMVVEGVRSVEAAIEAGAPLVEIAVTPESHKDRRIAALLARAGAPVYVLSEREFTRLSDVRTHQGILAVARIEPFPETQLETCRTVLALDGVQDPGNVGTAIRTAAWFGIDAVLSGPGTADVYSPKVVRAAMGGLWDVRVATTRDLAARLASLQSRGFTCYGADLEGTPARSWSPRNPSVLVVGSEAHGLSPVVRGRLDECVSIHGRGRTAGTESLNVAIAAGILMYAWVGAS